MSDLSEDNTILENITILVIKNVSSTEKFYKKAYGSSFIVLIVLFVLISVGNLSVLISICKTSKGSRMKFFIANLATNDLLVAVGAILPRIIWILTVQFYGPSLICKIVKYLASTVHYGSAFALVTLSLDRLHAIVRPMRFSSGRRNSFILAGTGWVLAMICGSPGLIMAEIRVRSNSNRQCWIDFNATSPKVYMTYVATSVFIIPAIMIAVSHILIIERIVRAARKQAFNGGSRGCIPRARVKTVQMTCVIVSVFVFCWCPYMVWNLLITYQVIDHHLLRNLNLSIIIQNLAPLNSAANPFIYWIFNTKKCSCRTGRRRNAGFYTNSHTKAKGPVKPPLYHTVIQDEGLSSGDEHLVEKGASSTVVALPNTNSSLINQWNKKMIRVDITQLEPATATDRLLTVNRVSTSNTNSIELTDVSSNQHFCP